jgi:hypothetical protein
MGTALDFDGVNDYVTGTITAVDTGGWTMLGWHYADTTGEGELGTIMSTGKGGVPVGQGLGVAGFGLNIYGVSQRFATQDAYEQFSGLDTGAWRCVAATQDGSTTGSNGTAYEGAEAAVMAALTTFGNQAGTGARDTGLVSAYIGNYSDGSQTWDGRLAYLAFVPRVMTLLDVERFRRGDWSVLWDQAPPRFFVTFAGGAATEIVSGSAWTVSGAVDATGPTLPFAGVYGGRFVANRGSFTQAAGSTAHALDMPAAASISTTNPGKRLILRVACDNAQAAPTAGGATALTVTDPRNTWTRIGTGALQDPGAANAGIQCEMYECIPTNAYTNGDDISIATADSAILSAYVEEWYFLGSVSDVNTAAGASTTPSVTSDSMTAGQTLICATAIEGPTGDTTTADTDTTRGEWQAQTIAVTSHGTAASNARIAGQTKVALDTGTQTYNLTITNRDWCQMAAIFGVFVGDATASPAVIARSFTLPAASLQLGASVTQTAIAAPAALPAATFSSPATQSPAVLATVAALPAATLSAGVSATQTAIASVAALPAATLSAGASSTQTAIATTAALPAATFSSAATESPAVIAAVAALPAASPSTGASVAQTAIATVAALPAATFSSAATVEPAVVPVVAALPAPTVDTGSGDASPSVSAIASVAALPAPTIAASSTQDATAIATVAALPASTVAASSTPTPAVTATVVAMPAAAPSAGSTVAPVEAAAVAALPAATVTGSATASPDVVATTASLPAASAGSGASVAATVIAAVVSLPGAAVAASTIVAATVLAGVVSLPVALVAAGATAVLDVVALVFGFPQATPSGTAPDANGVRLTLTEYGSTATAYDVGATASIADGRSALTVTEAGATGSTADAPTTATAQENHG